MHNPSILYGVQGTGNGHISRARLMAAEFRQLGLDVEYLFSGRAQNGYFDMEEFTSHRFCTGLSFVTSSGRIRKLRTLTGNQPIRYVHDVSTLRTDRHDLVISDFEPTVAWAARLRKTPTLAIGHQYALDEQAPRPQGGLFARWVIRNFAPGDKGIGFHWHPYGRLTLPPMIDTRLAPIHTGESFTLIYLPFEDQKDIAARLQRIRGEHFVMYSPEARNDTQCDNVSIYPLSKHGFRHHLQRSTRVICNTGFELIAEALHLGVPVLTRPLSGQFEQQANAMALEKLNLAMITDNLSVRCLDTFVRTSLPSARHVYPNVARELATFCLHRINAQLSPEQCDAALEEMASRLWAQVQPLSGNTTQSGKSDLPTRLIAA